MEIIQFTAEKSQFFGQKRAFFWDLLFPIKIHTS